MLYDDGRIACDDTDLVISRYYPWGAKTIPYRSIRSVKQLPSASGSGGCGAPETWCTGWNLDRGRPEKEIALEIDLGRRIRPAITPDDPETVRRILSEHLAGDS